MTDKYQGPVQEGYDEKHFRETGKTIKLGKDKAKKKTKSKKSSQLTRLEKLLKQKVTSRPILKKSKLTMEIKEREPHSILGEQNKFFDREMVSAKKEMYGI